MIVLLLLITVGAHLLCDWFALSTQIPLPFALMISEVYLADKAQECSIAMELGKARHSKWKIHSWIAKYQERSRLKLPIIHLFIQQISLNIAFLCARHCSRHWIYCSKPNRFTPPLCETKV